MNPKLMNYRTPSCPNGSKMNESMFYNKFNGYRLNNKNINLKTVAKSKNALVSNKID